MLQIIYNFFEDIGRARAANHLTALGQYRLAKEIMLREPAIFEVHP